MGADDQFPNRLECFQNRGRHQARHGTAQQAGDRADLEPKQFPPAGLSCRRDHPFIDRSTQHLEAGEVLAEIRADGDHRRGKGDARHALEEPANDFSNPSTLRFGQGSGALPRPACAEQKQCAVADHESEIEAVKLARCVELTGAVEFTPQRLRLPCVVCRIERLRCRVATRADHLRFRREPRPEQPQLGLDGVHICLQCRSADG